MSFDELPAAWRAANVDAVPATRREELIATASRRVERLWGSVYGRDVVETIAALFVIGCFGRALFHFEEPMAKAGAGVVVLGAVFIIFRLHAARFGKQRPALDAPIREFCATEIHRIERQVKLLHSVLWWYIAPCFLGANLVFTGLSGFGFASAAYFVATSFFCWWVYRVNRSAAAKSFAPVRDELAALLQQFDRDQESEPSG